MQLRNIQLQTHRIEALWVFYLQVLGFKGKRTRASIQFEVGTSHLTFTPTTDDSMPYYHFAFNIPYNLYKEALAWLEARVEVLANPSTGDKIIDFKNWSAYAMYFCDPAGNIVEFIARRDVPTRAAEPFSIQSVLSVSEIGIAIEEVDNSYQYLKEKTDLPIYGRSSGIFLAAGNEEGLFIMVDQAKKVWFPTDYPALSFPLTVEFVQDGKYRTLVSNERKVSVD